MTTLPGRVIGAKPAAFCAWVFGLLGAGPGDTLHDLYPGSGAISRAWAVFTGQPDPPPEVLRDPSPEDLHDGSRPARADASPQVLPDGSYPARADASPVATRDASHPTHPRSEASHPPADTTAHPSTPDQEANTAQPAAR